MTTYRLVMPEDMNHYGFQFVRVDECGNKLALCEG